MKQIVKGIIYFILVFGVGFFLRKCSKTEQKPIIKEHYVRDSIKVTDTIINNIVQERIKIRTKLDTLNKIIYVPRTVIIKDSVLCDSLYSLALIQKKMISNDSNLIAKQNISLRCYKRLDTLNTIKYDSLYLEFDKVKLKYYWRGVKHGFFAGNVTGFGGSVLLRK
jgi:hypothetical protein